MCVCGSSLVGAFLFIFPVVKEQKATIRYDENESSVELVAKHIVQSMMMHSGYEQECQ